MSRLHRRTALAATAVAALLWTLPASADTTLLNVSYDPTRELYQDFNEAFADALEGGDRRDGHHPAVARRLGQAGARGDRRPRRRRRDAGAGLRHRRDRRQGRQAAQGLAERACRTTARPTPRRSCSWCARAIPKGIKDWDDLVKPGVSGDHAQPEDLGRRALELPRRLWLGAATSSAATRPRPRQFVAELFHNVPVLDTGARGSTTTFVQRGIGDVLLAWENEAFLALNEFGADKFEIVVPPVSILAEPPVARGRRTSTPRARARWPRPTSSYLYSPEGQELAAKHYYRPSTPRTLAAGRPRPLPEGRAVRHRRVRRLEGGAGHALRRRRRVRPDLQAGQLTMAAALTVGLGIRQPSVIPGFGLALGSP